MKLTQHDKKYISTIIKDASERYPLQIIAAFKGPLAFDLHSKMVSLQKEDKKKSCLLIFIQTTVSKATLKNPSIKPAVSKRQILIIFDKLRSGYAYTSSYGKKSLKLIEENKANNLSSKTITRS